LYAHYKGYRILTQVKDGYGIFEIFTGPRAIHPGKFEATGYVMDDYSGASLEAAAQARAKSLIDVEMETLALAEIRKIPRY
jgi:hypothetical protein